MASHPKILSHHRANKYHGTVSHGTTGSVQTISDCGLQIAESHTLYFTISDGPTPGWAKLEPTRVPKLKLLTRANLAHAHHYFPLAFLPHHHHTRAHQPGLF
jgi:hypothetical protein